MIIEFISEETGNVKKINYGINWFLLLTAPVFGITLFKNKLNRSGFIMLTASLLFFLGIICFSIFSSSFAGMYPYGTSQVQAAPSFMMQVYYLLDIDYKDVLEFFLVSSAFLLLFISVFSCFTAYNANKWIAENYRYEGYKVAAPNTIVRNLLKKDWGLTDDDFIEESK
ncbi:MAG: hypothetical protein K2N11_06225 [Mucispirillum sp.]|nr:hypothetical protein [Mucispirillum sp.]